jgi:dimethylhistidine N-methyltransferase
MTATRAALTSGIAADVLEGLSRRRKALPPTLFYDAAGSALFEQITRLPEYYLTRAEAEILTQHAEDIVQAAGPQRTVVELGAGTAEKTRILLRAMLRRQLLVDYLPVDLSNTALAKAKRSLALESPRVRVSPKIGALDDLAFLKSCAQPQLVLYIGSSIGNLHLSDAVRLLRSLRANCNGQLHLLLGTDLAKDPRVLLPAYHDAQGVTAEFNKNLLTRINRELGANFNLASFRHLAEWNAEASRIEMYLVSTCKQEVSIPALARTFQFARGERIHTENSHKYTVESVRRMLSAGGFELRQSWTDPRDWYALHLARSV